MKRWGKQTYLHLFEPRSQNLGKIPSKALFFQNIKSTHNYGVTKYHKEKSKMHLKPNEQIYQISRERFDQKACLPVL
jgi:hypothetical protein